MFNRMIAVLAVALCVLTASPLTTNPVWAAGDIRLNFEDARHLLLRTGFAPTETEIAALAGTSRHEAVDKLLNGVRDEAITVEPDWLDIWPPNDMYSDDMTDGQMMAAVAEETGWRMDVKVWWLHEMLNTPAPLTEQLVLFWNNYFTMSLAEIRWPQSVLRNNFLLRKHALGNFREMLMDISRDPGFMAWLDIDENTKESPNENYGREIMELYTLGIGNYTEKDIIEAARALTGWKINEETGESYFSAEDHDEGEKTVLGRTGNFGLEEIVDILLEEKETARFITRRAWRHFIGHETKPTDEQVEHLASILRDNDYELRPFFRELLLSEAFWAPENRGNMVKSHMELILGAVNQLDLDHTADEVSLAVSSMEMGQDIMDHVTVAGWAGGREWVNTATLPTRMSFLNDSLSRWAGTVTTKAPKPKTYIDAWGNTREVGTGIRPKPEKKAEKSDDFDERSGRAKSIILSDEEVEQLARTILPRPPLRPLPEAPVSLKEAMTALMMDPVYQLK